MKKAISVKLIQHLKEKGKYDLTMSSEQMVGVEKAIKWLKEYKEFQWKDK